MRGVQKDPGRDIGGGKAPTRSQPKEVNDAPEQKPDARGCVAGNIVIPKRWREQDISPWQKCYGV